MKNKNWPIWSKDDQSVVSCTEKIKVMSENFDELKQLVQDACVKHFTSLSMSFKII